MRAGVGKGVEGAETLPDRPEPLLRDPLPVDYRPFEADEDRDRAHNLPLLSLYLVGAWTLAPLGWVWPITYLLYCLGSNLWFIKSICPSCRLYGRAACPSGYGRVSARIAPRGDPSDFPRRFRRNIGVVALGWVIPLVGGAVVLSRSLQSALSTLYALVPLILFSILGFYALPALSKGGCGSCPMRRECPGARFTVAK